jgi:hypothetical protein
MTKKQKETARKASIALRPFVDAVLVATVYAKAERERVDTIARGLLAERVYMVKAEFQDRRGAERITEPRYDYLMEDAEMAEYCAKLQAIHLANGYADAANGKCPALVAENEQRKAERALLDAAGEFVPGISHETIMNSADCLGNYKKAIDLLTGLVVCNPDYENPLERIKRGAERKADLTI